MDLAEYKTFQNSSVVRHPWEICRSQIVNSWLQKPGMERFRVLDFGCGDGFVLSQIAQQFEGASGEGFDPELTPGIASSLALGPHFKVVSKTSEISPGEAFDLGLLLDVLEHTDQESAVLNIILNRLKSQGRMIVTVPAFQFLFSRHDEILGHRRRYCLSQLTQVLTAHGFQIVQSGYLFQSLLIVRLIQKIFKMDGKTLSVNQWTKGPWLTRMIVAILHLEFKFHAILSSRGVKVPGLSCFAVCQKSSS